MHLRYVDDPEADFRVLVDLATGTLWDISDFLVQGGLLRNGNLYVGGWNNGSALYRIDMETWTAYPLNNPDYDPVAGNCLIDFVLSCPQ